MYARNIVASPKSHNLRSLDISYLRKSMKSPLNPVITHNDGKVIKMSATENRVTVAEMAKALQVSPSHIYNILSKRDVQPAYTKGKTSYYEQSLLEELKNAPNRRVRRNRRATDVPNLDTAAVIQHQQAKVNAETPQVNNQTPVPTEQVNQTPAPVEQKQPTLLERIASLEEALKNQQALEQRLAKMEEQINRIAQMLG